MVKEYTVLIMKISIENKKHGKFIKDFPDKNESDFWKLANKDIYDDFLASMENKYETTLEFHGVNDEFGFSLVDSIVSENTFKEVFNEFVEFVEKN